MSQLEVLKVRLGGETVAASVSPDMTETVTSPVGRVASLTENVVEPSSFTVSEVVSIIRLGVRSLSVTVTVTDPVTPS